MRRNADKYPDKPAIVFEDQQISWSELWQKTELAAGAISAFFGGKQQEVATILAPNSIDFVIAYLAILHTGNIALLLDPAYKKLELDAITDQIPSSLIIVAQELADSLSRHHEPVIILEKLLSSTGHKETEPLRLAAEKQVASLTFTSGTTGKSKTVPYTHANHIWNIKVCSQVWDWKHDDSLLVNVPLGHFNGVVMSLSGAIYHGNTVYLHRWFDEQSALEALASGKITMFNHAASAYVKLVAFPKSDYDLSKVRLCTSGAAPLPPAVWQEFKRRYGVEILETYGSSETGRIAGNRLNERLLGSPGKPLPGVELRLNEASEVEVKSGGLFPGYYKNPSATKAALTDDGFWRTGDIAEIRDGYVFLRGRVQEQIRRFGYTVSPRDVEWAMHKHPKIKDIYVMGRQMPGAPNDELIYFVVGDVSDEEIKEYCKTNLIFVWRPDKIIRLKDLPRTRSGKARLAELRQMVTAES